MSKQELSSWEIQDLTGEPCVDIEELWEMAEQPTPEPKNEEGDLKTQYELFTKENPMIQISFELWLMATYKKTQKEKAEMIEELEIFYGNHEFSQSADNALKEIISKYK